MKNVFLYCGNGYLFKEFYEPIIRELDGKCNTFFIIEDSFLSKKILELLNNLQKSGTLKKYYVTRFHVGNSISKQYLECLAFLKKIKTIKVNVFSTSEEGSPIICFLMEYFKTKGGIVITADGLLRAELHLDFHSREGDSFSEHIENLNINWKQKLKNKFQTKGFGGIIDSCVNKLIRPFKVDQIRKRISSFLGFRLFPLLLMGKILKKPTLYKIGTYSENLITVDSVEYECVKLLVPSIRNLYLAKHPSYCLHNSPSSKQKRKLLVMIGGPIGSICNHKIERWVSVVKKIKALKAPSEIHLRNHPRENEYVVKQFQEAFIKKNIKTIQINASEKSIADGFEEYMGVVGSPSTGLRFSREAAQNIFVIGIANAAQQNFHSHPLVLGNTEGIHWLYEGDILDEKFLNLPKLPKKEHPSIGEILIKILENQETNC